MVMICSSLYGRFSGIKSVLKACLFVNSIEPDNALLKIESSGLGCFCMYLTWYVELSTGRVRNLSLIAKDYSLITSIGRSFLYDQPVLVLSRLSIPRS